MINGASAAPQARKAVVCRFDFATCSVTGNSIAATPLVYADGEPYHPYWKRNLKDQASSKKAATSESGQKRRSRHCNLQCAQNAIPEKGVEDRGAQLIKRTLPRRENVVFTLASIRCSRNALAAGYVVKILGPVAGVLNRLSDAEPIAIAWADRKAAFSCSFAALKGGAAAREAVSGTYSARDCVAPELAPTSFAPLRALPCLSHQLAGGGRDGRA
jgi:hypothetical protein